MNTSVKIGAAVIIIVAIIAGVAVWHNNSTTQTPADQSDMASTTQTGTTSDQTTSDGTITFALPANWGLATNQEQILVKSYIPACSENFNYCLYYNGSDYAGTNFESAGLRIDQRTDLKTQTTCLQTSPEGFDTMKPASTKTGSDYSTSVFSNVGDAGAGHTASGSLYRLYVPSSSSCYEFETRVGQTQFANYPAGAIKEFTAADQTALQNKIKDILNNISLPSGETNLFS